MQRARLNRLRGAVAYTGLAICLGVVTMVLSQCTLVSDNVTGLGLRSQRATCIQACRDTRDACIAQAAHDCGGRDNACFEAELQECQEDFKACKDSCHKQGVGSAG